MPDDKAISNTASGPVKRQFYGRRQGHTLRKSRRALVESRLESLSVMGSGGGDSRVDLDRLYPFPVREFWLEIGFGGGEHLLAQASANPDVGMIGCEPFINGVAGLLAQADARGIRNIRVHPDDARDLLDVLPDGALDRVFILFPDPWPKTRHHRRRIVTMETLDALARVMKRGAELRLATDHTDYGHWMLAHIQRHSAFAWMAESADDWTTRTGDWPPTRYEAKALKQGEECLYLRIRRDGRERVVEKTT